MDENQDQPNQPNQENQPKLRSINNLQRSYVRFINKSPRPIILLWIDYNGKPLSYGHLLPGNYRDIDTFVTHPWIFQDTETKQRCTVDQKDVFFPEPCSKYEDEDAIPVMNQNRIRKIVRIHVWIMLPVNTLRNLSMIVIKKHLRYDRDALFLEIPRSLQCELVLMPPRKSLRIVRAEILQCGRVPPALHVNLSTVREFSSQGEGADWM